MTQGITRSSGCRCGLVATALLLAAGGRIAPGADASGSPKKAQPKFELKDGDRVVFLGNTLIEREQKYGYWETMLTARYPDRKIIFRNLGWDGDTVWAESRGMFDPPEKGYARMLAHVGSIKPTVIFLGYGNNEAFAGKAGLPRFVKQYNKLLDDLTRVSAKGVRFVLLTPYLYEARSAPLPNPAIQNENIREYARAINDISSQREAGFVDLVSFCDIRSRKSRFRPRRPYTRDGISFTDQMWRSTGYLIDKQFEGGTGRLPLARLSFKTTGKISESRGAIISKITELKNGLRFSVSPTSVSDAVWSLSVRDLAVGEYKLMIDGIEIIAGKQSLRKKFRSDRLLDPRKKPLRFYNDLTAMIWGTPEHQQSENLRQTIIAKNRLYFHSWRPQNVTYLFLFRKHEQGQNAKEMQEFQRLVAAKEKEIDRLKKPVTRTYELIRVKAKKAKGGK